MSYKQSQAWHSELKESLCRKPDKDKGECCKAIALGQMTALRCDVHVGHFDAVFDMPVDFCFVCGHLLDREKIIKEFYGEI